MGHTNGGAMFNDRSMKHFEYSGDTNSCIPKLYDTYAELRDNWRNHKQEENHCNHLEEPIKLYTNYNGGIYWKGTACRKCMTILKGISPKEEGALIMEGAPNWDYNKRNRNSKSRKLVFLTLTEEEKDVLIKMLKEDISIKDKGCATLENSLPEEFKNSMSEEVNLLKVILNKLNKL